MSITYYSILKIFFRVFDEVRARDKERERAIAWSLVHSITSRDQVRRDGPGSLCDTEKEELKRRDETGAMVQL